MTDSTVTNPASARFSATAIEAERKADEERRIAELRLHRRVCPRSTDQHPAALLWPCGPQAQQAAPLVR